MDIEEPSGHQKKNRIETHSHHSACLFSQGLVLADSHMELHTLPCHMGKHHLTAAPAQSLPPTRQELQPGQKLGTMHQVEFNSHKLCSQNSILTLSYSRVACSGHQVSPLPTSQRSGHLHLCEHTKQAPQINQAEWGIYIFKPPEMSCKNCPQFLHYQSCHFPHQPQLGLTVKPPFSTHQCPHRASWLSTQTSLCFMEAGRVVFSPTWPTGWPSAASSHTRATTVSPSLRMTTLLGCSFFLHPKANTVAC